MSFAILPAVKVSPGIKEDVFSGTIKAPRRMIAETATETATDTKKPQRLDGDKLQQETAKKTVDGLQHNG